MTPTTAPLRTALRPPPRVLLNLFLAGLLLRLLALGYWSLWLDEGVTWTTATLPTWGESFFAEANHPPLWRLVTRFWIGMFGDSEASLRAPAAFLGVLSMGLAWILGLRLLDPAFTPRRGGFSHVPDGGRGRRTAVWFAGLLAVAAYFIEYAQEARMYSALLFESLALTWLYLEWLDRGRRGALIAYGAVAVLALHTHYFALWPLGAHAVHAAWAARADRGKAEALRAGPFLLTAAVAGLCFVPWLAWAVTHFERVAAHDAAPLADLATAVWRIGAGPALVVPDPTNAAGGLEAIVRRAGWVLVGATTVLWLVPVGLGLLAVRRRPGLASLVATGLLLPLALLFALSFALPVMHARYLVFLAPWLFLLAALGVTAGPPLLRAALGGGLAVLLAAGAIAYHGSSNELVPEPAAGRLDGPVRIERFVPAPNPPIDFLTGGRAYGREPWRQVRDTFFVPPRAQAGDLVALHPGYLHLVWDYYATRRTAEEAPLDTLRIPRGAVTEDALREACGDRLRGRRRVFLIQAAETTADPNAFYRTFRDLLALEWRAEGLVTLSLVPPVLFDLSWGIRVAVFTRS